MNSPPGPGPRVTSGGQRDTDLFVAGVAAGMAAERRSDGIRIAWNLVTETLTAVYPDDGTFGVVEVGFGGHQARDGQVPADVRHRAEAPGGPRLILGPTLGEIRAAFEEGGQ